MKFSLKRREVFSKIEPWLFLSPFLFFIILFTIYPVINVILLSFKQNYSFLKGTYSGINFDNYKYVLTDDKFVGAMKNTFLYVLFVVPISTAIAIFFANLLNQKIKGNAFFQTAFLFFGHTLSMWKFPSWGWNPCRRSCDLCQSCNNAGFLIHCTT